MSKGFVIGRGGTISDFGILLEELPGGVYRVALATMSDERDVKEVDSSEYRKIIVDSMLVKLSRRLRLNSVRGVELELVSDYLRIVDSLGELYGPFRRVLNSIEELSDFHIVEVEE